MVEMSSRGQGQAASPCQSGWEMKHAHSSVREEIALYSTVGREPAYNDILPC